MQTASTASQIAPQSLARSVPSLDPTSIAGRAVPVGPADVYDDHGFGAKLHDVQHLCLGRQVPDALPSEFGIGTFEDDVLRRVEGKADAEFTRFGADRPQLGEAYLMSPHSGFSPLRQDGPQLIRKSFW